MNLNIRAINWTKRLFFLSTLIAGIVFLSAPLMIISAAFFLLLSIERYVKIKIPFGMSAIFVVFIIVSLVLGSHFNFYERWLWLDDALHTFYGAAFAVIGFIIIQYLSALRGIRNDILIICLFSFCFSVAFGAMWEIYEFAFDVLFDGNMQRTDQGSGVTDTMSDIIVESSAAFAVNVFIYIYLASGAKNWVARMSEEFLSLNAR